jgi:hypothetical protein
MRYRFGVEFLLQFLDASLHRCSYGLLMPSLFCMSSLTHRYCFLMTPVSVVWRMAAHRRCFFVSRQLPSPGALEFEGGLEQLVSFRIFQLLCHQGTVH